MLTQKIKDVNLRIFLKNKLSTAVQMLLSEAQAINRHADVYQLLVVTKSSIIHKDIPLYRNCFNRITITNTLYEET